MFGFVPKVGFLMLNLFQHHIRSNANVSKYGLKHLTPWATLK